MWGVIEVPILFELLLQQHLVGAARRTVNCVIGAHHAIDMAIDYQLAKGGQVSIFEIVRGNDRVEGVSLGLRPAVDCEVLRGRRNFEIFRVVTL